MESAATMGPELSIFRGADRVVRQRVSANGAAQRVVVSFLMAVVLSLVASSSLAQAPDPCAASEGCALRGLCTEYQGRCYAATDAQCRAAEICNMGRCSAQQGRCVIASREDCQHAAGCRLSPCEVVEGACVGAKTTFSERKVTGDLSPGLSRAGMYMTLIGLGGAGVGGALLGAMLSNSKRKFESDVRTVDGAGTQLAMGLGVVFLAAGGASAVTGAVLWGIGSADVDRPAVRKESALVPRVQIGPTTLDATWAF
jgi:hypothetical protein